ncbi:MAG: septum formation initiator family protein [Bryobacterales bacterium]|nr:septum formation initiator family protein [Bryobacterales bacterium]
MSVRTILSAGALLLAGGYLLYSFLGPEGIPMVIEKRRQIRELQQQNSQLQEQIEQSRERMRLFNESASEREGQIREQQGKVKKGETIFILPSQ